MTIIRVNEFELDESNKYTEMVRISYGDCSRMKLLRIGCEGLEPLSMNEIIGVDIL